MEKSGRAEILDGNLVRLGGLFGLLAALVMIPAYLVGFPDAPGSLAEADLYFDAGHGAFQFFNGVLPLFHVFFFLWLLGVLRGMLRRAEPPAASRSVHARLPKAGF
jgi:hypothetical protein